ncbi:MAG: Protein translocase subunit SecD / Protein translocase subunit SecF [uncultured Adhaeribacter sp.]|uniref:Multifunctional fusion protein n=1 Tax=uncultured Adhaeribacter sp. TaxID=448109 RepID=A0A6J4IN39_9BACT|nr:MAG: Protein translocase subunit SecD / Protein translocase subunit SecF [uncultured Adhaeribacter sp.]
MRNKTGILLLTIIVTALCAYYLSFTFVSKGVQRDAEAYATNAKGIVDTNKKYAYLDSIRKEPVFNFLGLKYTYEEIQNSELSLGLDLKGGMHVTLEVSPVEIIKSMSGNSKDPGFLKALEVARQRQQNSQQKFTTLFAQAYREINPTGRLAGIFSNTANKGRINYNSTNEQVIAAIDTEVDGAIDRSYNILQTRIDKFGVNQPNIQRLKGNDRIQIELPGVTDATRVRKLLQGMANLEFWEVWKPEEFSPYFTQLNAVLAKQEAADKLAGKGAAPAAKGTNDDVLSKSAAKPAIDPLTGKAVVDSAADTAKANTVASAKTDSTKTDSLAANQSSQLAKLFTVLPGGLGTNVRDTAKVNALFRRPEVRAIFPANMKFLWAVKPIVGQDKQEFLEFYAIKKGRDNKAPVTGDAISDARQDFDQQGRPEVTMGMNVSGAKKWQRLTAATIDRQVAIVLDNYVYSAPVVQGEIPNGNSSISGNFTVEEAQDLANILKAGKMPAPTRIVEEAIVGPSLGQEAINQGLLSSIAAMVVVVIFMVFYYSKGGFVADLALLFNIFFIIGILAQFSAALTLPGIAGMVLTMGMSVDANVLIFERIREELASGLNMKDAINKGYSRAFSSIFDSNVTTLLAGIILFFFGSGPVKGFAITLMLGIATSFFTAVFVSRLFVEWMTRGKDASNMSFSTVFSRNLFKKFNFNFIKYRKVAYIGSTTVILLGFILMYFQGGPNLGVDFKGGRAYLVNFNEAVPASEVRSALIDDFKGAGTDVKTFGASNRLKVTTSYMAEDESTNADETVQAALETGLKQYNAQSPQVLSSSKVGATMADDIQKQAIISVLLSFAGIFLYVMLRFRKWQYSLGGVVALIHDALMVTAFFAIGRLFGLNYEMDQVFIASILTIIGFSINDTVVIYDRIRENLGLHAKSKIRDIINPALNDTLSRTIITSLTVLFVVLILFIFGGETLRGFSYAMLVGVISGTYSTLFIATPILLDTVNDDKPTATPATVTPKLATTGNARA